MLSHVWLFATPRTVRPPGSSDFPGKTTGVGYYFLLQGILWPRDQTHISYIGRRVHYHWATWKSCLTLCDPRDCSLPGSSVHGILQARILEWVAIPSSSGSSPPRDWTWVSCSGRQILYHLTYQGSPCATWETLKEIVRIKYTFNGERLWKLKHYTFFFCNFH